MHVSGPFALVNLKPDTLYITKILARNRAGFSAYTDTIEVRTLREIVNNGATGPSDGSPLHHLLIVIAAALFAARL